MANIDDTKIPVGGIETPIVGRVHDVSEDHVVTGANEVFDDVKKKRQSVINKEHREGIDLNSVKIEAEKDDRRYYDEQLRSELNEKQLEIGAVELDSEPTLGSPNHLTSGVIARSLGSFNKSTEYIYTIVDAAKRFLAGIRADGSVDWAKGVPEPIKAFVEELLSAIVNGSDSEKIDGLNKIIEFLDGVNHPFKGKKVSILGDSISTFNQAGYKIDGYDMYYPTSDPRSSDVATVYDTWWKKVIDSSGALLEVNASDSGSTASNLKRGFSPRVSVLGNPDVIFVALGTNDSNGNVEIGEIDYYASEYDLSKFAPAYIKGIQDTIAAYPYATIVCVAFDMNTPYQDVIRNVAEHYGCAYIYVGDISDVHPNKAEMYAVYRKIYGTTLTLENLLDTKVDKENDKGLIDIDFASGVSTTDHSEYLLSLIDKKKRFILGVRNDGEVIFGTGVPAEIKEYIDSAFDSISFIKSIKAATLGIDVKDTEIFASSDYLLDNLNIVKDSNKVSFSLNTPINAERFGWKVRVNKSSVYTVNICYSIEGDMETDKEWVGVSVGNDLYPASVVSYVSLGKSSADEASLVFKAEEDAVYIKISSDNLLTNNILHIYKVGIKELSSEKQFPEHISAYGYAEGILRNTPWGVTYGINGYGEISEVKQQYSARSISDTNPITYEDGSPIYEDNSIFIAASARLGEKTVIYKLDVNTYKLKMVGVVIGTATGGVHIIYNRQDGYWYYTVHGTDTHQILMGKSINSPLSGITYIQYDFLAYNKKGGDEEDAVIRFLNNKWYMAACKRIPNTDPNPKPEDIRHYELAVWQASSIEGPYKLSNLTNTRTDPYDPDVPEPNGKAFTGTSIMNIGGAPYIIMGHSWEQGLDGYSVFTLPNDEPPAEELPDEEYPDVECIGELKINHPTGGHRGWGGVIPVINGLNTEYLFITFDRYVFLRSYDPWSYGHGYIYKAQQSNPGIEYDIYDASLSRIIHHKNVVEEYTPLDLTFDICNVLDGTSIEPLEVASTGKKFLHGNPTVCSIDRYENNGLDGVVTPYVPLNGRKAFGNGTVTLVGGVHNAQCDYKIELNNLIKYGGYIKIWFGSPDSGESIKVYYNKTSTYKTTSKYVVEFNNSNATPISRIVNAESKSVTTMTFSNDKISWIIKIE